MSSLQHRVGHHNCGPVLATNPIETTTKPVQTARTFRHVRAVPDPYQAKFRLDPPIKTFGGAVLKKSINDR